MTSPRETTHRLAPAFEDPVMEAQAAFRQLLAAQAQPGSIAILRGPVPPPPLGIAAGAVALTLLDHDTRLWLGDRLLAAGVDDYLRFHCGCPLVRDPSQADFGFASDPSDLPPLDRFMQGDDLFPHRSTTVVVEVSRLASPGTLRLVGPGIETETSLEIGPMSEDFWATRRAMQADFPLGVDLIFTSGDSLAAFPRSTSLAGNPCM